MSDKEMNYDEWHKLARSPSVLRVDDEITFQIQDLIKIAFTAIMNNPGPPPLDHFTPEFVAKRSCDYAEALMDEFIKRYPEPKPVKITITDET